MGTVSQLRGRTDAAEAAAFGQPDGESGPDFEPIAGVALEQFAEVTKGIAAFNYDQSRLAEVAAARGIDPVSWETASQGWSSRMQVSPALAQQFNQLYRRAEQ
jgi:hypothetical protein